MKNEEEKRVDKGVDKGHVDCNLKNEFWNSFEFPESSLKCKVNINEDVDKCHVDRNLTILTFNFVLIFFLKFSEQPKKKKTLTKAWTNATWIAT